MFGFFGLYIVGPKNSREIPAQFPQEFPCKKPRSFHRQATVSVQEQEQKIASCRKMKGQHD